MKESIKLVVVDDRDDNGREKELEIMYEDGVLSFTLDGNPLFSGDWEGSNHFNEVFKRASQLWGIV
jgi:hypothetical protein